MRILLTTWTLARVNGCITSLIAIYDELCRIGHSVDVWTLQPGFLSRRVRCVPRLDQGPYDLALVNQNVCLRQVVKDQPARRIVFTIHGTVPAFEQPLPGADVYVAVSERVQQHVMQAGYKSHLIRNGVDLNRFVSRSPSRPTLNRLGFLSRHERGYALLQAACQRVGCELYHMHRVLDVVKGVNECDAIATIGRGVIESIACSRPVLVFDHPSAAAGPKTDGWFTEEMAAGSAFWNYTGWHQNTVADVNGLSHLLRDYDACQGEANRRYAERHHNIADKINEYLNLA